MTRHIEICSDMFVLFAGAPGCGKSTIIGDAIRRYSKFSHHQLDTFIAELCEEQAIMTPPLSDDLIELAVERLLKGISGRCFVELPHHDYIGIVRSGILKLGTMNSVVVIDADSTTVLARNKARPVQIPEEYVRRCIATVQTFKMYLLQGHIDHLVLDTTSPNTALVGQRLADYLDPRCC